MSGSKGGYLTPKEAKALAEVCDCHVKYPWHRTYTYEKGGEAKTYTQTSVKDMPAWRAANGGEIQLPGSKHWLKLVEVSA